MNKTYRIMILKPGGRYGQLPMYEYMLDLGGKEAKFGSESEAQKHINQIKGSQLYNAISAQYRPTYKVV